MRKLCLFICAMLMVISAAYATAVTENISLASFEVYQNAGVPHGTFNPSTLVFSEIKAWGGGQLWYSDENSSALDAEDFTHIGLDLAEAATHDVRILVIYTEADGKAEQNQVLEAGETSKLLALNGRYIKKIEIKNWSSADNASFTMSKLYFFKAIGKEDSHNLFTGTQDVGSWTWDQRLIIAKENFAAVHEGDRIVITYTSGASGQCGVRIKSDIYFVEPGQYAPIEKSQTDADYSFVIREADIASLQANGMYITGTSLTISKVDLVTYEQQFMAETLFNTSAVATEVEWSNVWQTSNLPTFSAGDELRVNVVEIRTPENKQLYFCYDWTFDNYIAVTGIDNTVPKTYSVTLSPEQAAAINAAGMLFVNGTGVSINRFSYAQPYGIYHTLWHGEQGQEIDWTGLFFANSSFSEIEVGDILCAKVSAMGTEPTDYPQLWMIANWTEFSPKAHYYFNENNIAPMTVSFVVNEAMKSELQSRGLRVRGAKCTVTDVYVHKATAATRSYTLTVSTAGMATLVLPFNVPSLPAGVEAYSLTNNGDETIWADPVTSIEADKPVLIVASAGDYIFNSGEGDNWDISGKAWSSNDYSNSALIGNYAPNRTVPQTTDDNYNYVLQNGTDGVAFYQVKDNACTISPYRAYLSCSHNHSAGGAQHAPMKMVFRPTTPTGEESVQSLEGSIQKVLRDGQIYILRDNHMYTIQGQLVK